MSNPKIGLTGQESRVLSAFSRYPYLTAPLATLAAGYSPRNEGHVGESLTSLTRKKYLRKFDFHNKPGPGNPMGVWAIYDLGRKHLTTNEGYEHLPPVHATPEQDHFLHELALAQALIAYERLGALCQVIKDLAIQPDYLLKQTPFRVTATVIKKRYADGKVSTEQKPMSIVPDGMVQFSVQGGHTYNLWHEADRGTEAKGKWQEKVAGIVAYAEAINPQRVDVVVTIDPVKNVDATHRRNMLWSWTGEMLQVLHREEWADIFHITDVPVDPLDPYTFFSHPHWVRPYDDELLALVILPQEAWP